MYICIYINNPHNYVDKMEYSFYVIIYSIFVLNVIIIKKATVLLKYLDVSALLAFNNRTMQKIKHRIREK